MAIIKQYNTPNYGTAQTDISPITSGLTSLVGTLAKQKSLVDKDQDYKMRSIEKAKLELDPVKDLTPKMQENAVNKINELENNIAEKLTFEQDTKGFKKLKRVIGLEPKLTDDEYINIINEIGSASKEFDKWRNEFTEFGKEDAEYKKNPEKYDSRQYQMSLDNFYKTGERPLDKNGKPKSILSPAAKNVYKEVVSNEMDSRSAADKEKKVTRNGIYITEEVKGLPPEIQNQTYYARAEQDAGFQKGLVNSLIAYNGMSEEDKISYVMGSIDPNAFSVDRNSLPDNLKPLYDENAKIRRSEVEKMFADLKNNNEYAPELIEAATDFGAHILKLPSKIGEGYSRTEIDPAKDPDKEDITPLQERKVNFAGVNYDNYVDLSTVSSEYTEVSNYKLPKNSMKFVEKINPSTGATIPINAKGKDLSRIKIKNPIETKTENNYTIAGWDKSKNIIRLVLKDKYHLESGEQESYMVPYRGNEYLVEDTVKKMQGKNATAMPSTELTEGFFNP
ncbi:hypothetical protein JW865_09415 [Candidatus Bathyarchaeota archaeon]|nr:hypothetical protein [Candidatus Bathyarchaeota archaeon]